MRDAIPFTTMIKEVPFIFDNFLPNLEVFCKVFEYNQGFISVEESNISILSTKILPLSIIIYKVLNKRKLFGYVTLVPKKTVIFFYQATQRSIIQLS